MQNMIKIRSNW